MRKKFLLLIIVVAIVSSLYCGSIINANADEIEVYLGGMPAGFIIDNKGASIIGVNDVISKEGLFSPAKDCGIKSGDVLISLDGKEVNRASDIENILDCYEGNGVTAVIDRDGEVLIKIIYPAKDIGGKYRLGMFIRDDVTGIGTVTYIKENGEFGSLGHPVVDGKNQRNVKINGGKIFGCNVIGVNKSSRGKAGELRGYFIEDKVVGNITSNKNQGLFGELSDSEFYKNLKKISTGEAKVGRASIYTTVDGFKPCKYEISIVKTDAKAGDNKNLVVKITDENLVSISGGIVQGMSGSPIVQEGKLVGAITHVFINDPTRGFGITINNMLSA